ncbi:MAG: PVC-type heme-binding CxxCH protein [Gemmataceae bacterium]
MFALLLVCLAQDPAPLRNVSGPYEPAEAVKHFNVPPGFKVTPVAHEPAIVDPVCMCFDARGRIFVCEMPGYPNGGRALGEETRGKIKMLEDKDGDGFFETVTLFADGLRFPTGITPYKDGLIVCNAPEIIYLKDTKGTGKADLREVWYTGFELANIQQLPNSLQWGPDSKIWGMVAGTGGLITCPKKPEMKAVNLRGKGFRFDPAKLGSFEATSGGGQYGLARDANDNWFTCSNGNCVRQIVLPEELATRNPDYIPPEVTADIDVEGTAIKVFRKSPFETWRVERTTRRREGEDRNKFIPTELVPGGFTSSTCGCLIYDAGHFPTTYQGSFFGCDPGNNLIFRRVLMTHGAIYQSSRPPEEKECEFLASDDNWFRPVWMTLGPDGAIYVCDFYREVIETPLSIPDDMKKRLNVESRGRGRIWRIARDDYRPAKPANFAGFPESKWKIIQRDFPNQTVKTTAARLLNEQTNKTDGKITKDDEAYLANNIAPKSTKTESVPSTAKQGLDPEIANVLKGEKLDATRAARILSKFPGDRWIQSVVLCNLNNRDFIDLLPHIDADSSLAKAAATIIGRKQVGKEIADVLTLVAENKIDPIALTGLGLGMQAKGKTLANYLAHPPAEGKVAAEKLHKTFEAASQKSDEASMRMLAFASFDLAKPALVRVLTPATPSAVQAVAIRSLGQQTNPSVAGLLIEKWPGLSPTLRKEVLDVLMSKPDRTQALLSAVEKGGIKIGEIDVARVQLLRNHSRAEIRTRALKVFAAATPADRKKVLADYESVIEMKGDAAKGKTVFQNQCASCHKLAGLGNDVGPNLLATIPGKSTRDLLTAILDPNREVDTRFLSYTASLQDGRVLTGIIVNESASGITLRQADGKEDTIARRDLESLKSSGQSLMPEGLEKQIPPQSLADLIAFLKQAPSNP